MCDPELAEILSLVHEVFSTDDEAEVTTEIVRQAEALDVPNVAIDDCIRNFKPVRSSTFDSIDSSMMLYFRPIDGKIVERQLRWCVCCLCRREEPV